MDSAIYRINHYPLDSAIGLPAIHWIMIYPVDSAILLLNNWAWQPAWQTFDREGERSAPGTLTYRTSASSATQAIFHGASLSLFSPRVPYMKREEMLVMSFRDDDDGNKNGKKQWVLRLAKQQLCTCITLFSTFLCRRCMTTT